MISKTILSIGAILLSGLFVNGQTPEAVKPSLAMGDVVSISESKIVVQTKDGSLDVTLSDKTEFKRVPPENPSLKAAVAAAFADIGTGDKLVVTGIMSADKKTLPARSVYLMTKADISQRHAKESEQWRTRGITGRVASVNPQTNQISVEMRGLTATTTLTLTPKENAKFRRYAPDSIKFSEAKESSLAEVQAGDMIRALGDRGADGTSFAAEEIVTGAFQTVAGAVKTVDAAKNEVVISDIRTKKDVTVALGSVSLMKKFPEEMAQRLAQVQGGARPPGQGGTPPQGGPGRGVAGGQRGGMGGQRGGIDEMLERFPDITAADLKPGDMIAVSSTKTANADHITAIKLLAGVEPFLKAAEATSGGRRGQGGTDGGFTIPGLDGFSGP